MLSTPDPIWPSETLSEASIAEQIFQNIFSNTINRCPFTRKCGNTIEAIDPQLQCNISGPVGSGDMQSGDFHFLTNFITAGMLYTMSDVGNSYVDRQYPKTESSKTGMI